MNDTVNLIEESTAHLHEWNRHEERNHLNSTTKYDANSIFSRTHYDKTSKARCAIKCAKHWIEE